MPPLLLLLQASAPSQDDLDEDELFLLQHLSVD
jgi:hypothetical protein